MNPYAIAFSIGYYYGRAFPIDAMPSIRPHDERHRANKGFDDGLEAGRRDYQEVDLPIQAMEENINPMEIL